MADPPIVVRSVVDHLLAAQQGSIAVGLDEVYYSIVEIDDHHTIQVVGSRRLPEWIVIRTKGAAGPSS